jgi:TDG/mug DNA glycosylase family protein
MTSSGFNAVAGPDARVLILGTLPGALSLEMRQYYAQPRNAFWRIMADVAGVGPDLPYDERLRRLVGRRLALWDVCASATRPGSLDAAIRTASVRPNDFARFFAAHPDLQLVCFNGARAGALFRRLVLPTLKDRWAGLGRVTLPSTSPAYASMPVRRKIQIWRAALTKVER